MTFFHDYFITIKDRIRSHRTLHSIYQPILLIIHILLYTFTSPLSNLVRLSQTFWACRVLSFKDSENYAGFTTLTAGTWPFYFRFSLALSMFGRKGVSPYLGLGNYPLKNFFYYSESLCFFRKNNNHLILISLFCWWLIHLVWLTDFSISRISIIMVMALLSTTFIGIISMINYNVMGWLFFPLALYGLQTGHWFLVGFAWLGVSFGSFTVLFIGGIFTIIASFSTHSIVPLLAYTPACIKMLLNLLPLFSSNNLIKTLADIAKIIGFSSGKEIRYKRSKAKNAFSAFDKWYYSVIIIQFLIISYCTSGYLNLYLISGFLIFLVNTTLIRFADEENMWILIFSLATSVIIQSSNISYWPILMISYWILISPLPRTQFLKELMVFRVIPTYKPLAPVNIKPILNQFAYFFKQVGYEKRIFMAFNEPAGSYAKIFDGLRFHIEFPLYIALKNKIHLFPDWLAVIQTNYIGAPNCWGREPDEVIQNLALWHADYVMIYQKDSNKLEDKWEKSGFNVISFIDCQDYFYNNIKVNWWLLESPEIHSNN